MLRDWISKERDHNALQRIIDNWGRFTRVTANRMNENPELFGKWGLVQRIIGEVFNGMSSSAAAMAVC